MNWRESKRNSTKSLVNFLQLSKSVPNKFIRSTARENMTPLSSLSIRQKMEKKEVF